MPPSHTVHSCLPGSRLPASGEVFPAKPNREPASGSLRSFSENPQLYWVGRFAAASVPPHHQPEPPPLRRRSASPNIGTLPPIAPLRSSYDQPSTRSQLRVVLAFPTSSSLRPAGLTDRGAQEEFYPLRPSPDGSEFPE